MLKSDMPDWEKIAKKQAQEIKKLRDQLKEAPNESDEDIAWTIIPVDKDDGSGIYGYVLVGPTTRDEAFDIAKRHATWLVSS